jgi:PAS domain S-box-containing protein
MRLNGASDAAAPELKLVLIEGDPGECGRVRDLCEGLGRSPFALVQCAGVQEAVDAVTTEEVGCALLCVSGSGRGTVDKLGLLNSSWPSAPVVVVASTGDDQRALEALERGAHDYVIGESLDDSRLERAIDHAIERSRAELPVARTATKRGFSEPDYESLIERIPGIVYVAAPGEGGEWLYASSHVERLLGYTVEEWLADPSLWYRRLHPGDRDRALADEARSRALGAPLDSEYRMIARDGTTVWFHDQASLVQAADGQEPFFQGVMLDVTDRKRAEEDVAESRARLAEAQRIAGVGSWRWDVAEDRVEWSEELFRMYGLAKHELRPTYEGYLERVHPDEREWVAQTVNRALADRTSFEFECRMVRPDGTVRVAASRGDVIVDAAGEPTAMVGTAQDVTAEKEAERALKQSKALKTAVVESALDCIITTDHEGRVLEFNRAAELTFGYRRDEALGRDLAELVIPPAFREAHRRGLARVSETGEGRILGQRLELTGMRSDGSEFPIELAIARIGGDPPMYTGFLRDITERRAVEHALREAHDQMQAIIDNSPSIIWAKDISFRYLFVNRAFERMHGVEPGSAIGRLDEEVMEPDAAARARAGDTRVLERSELVREEEVIVDGGLERTFLTQKFPLRDAAGRIYAVCAISTDITERKRSEDALRAQIDWSTRVRQAIANDRLVLHAQPIIDLRTGEVRQQELLVRMVGSRGKDDLMMPGEFLGPAERFGLVQEIDHWVVRRAIALAKEQPLEVNLSAKSIGDRNLISLIQMELAANETPAGNVIFEITETAAAENLDAAREFVVSLTDIGCGFALDDFGTGFGSFNYLKHLPVTYLKIDMEFVRNLPSDESDRKVVKSIVEVARNFGMQTVAEGVEHEETIGMLCDLGVDYAQGYFIGHPGPVA